MIPSQVALQNKGYRISQAGKNWDYNYQFFLKVNMSIKILLDRDKKLTISVVQTLL
jgi:hypothetical protein